jgi:flagellar basal body-associated protein FliL
MSETKLSETKPKKMVRRSVAVALGIVCIVLIAALSVAMSQTFSSSSQVNDLTDSLNLRKYVVLLMEKDFY